MQCRYCHGSLHPERAVTYDYCLADDCQDKGVRAAAEDWRRKYTPALLPKQGYVWVERGKQHTLKVK